MADGWMYTPTRIAVGPDSIERLGLLVKQYGSRALIVTEEVLDTWGIIEKARASLESAGIHSIIFSDVTVNSGSGTAERAAVTARTSRAQMIIGLGGVKTASLAKCAAGLTPGTQQLDFILSGEDFGPDALPFIEVPTTPRSPFLMTDAAVIIDDRDRSVRLVRTGRHAELGVLDPKITLSLSPKQTAMMMLECFLTAAEGYTSRKRSFLARTLLSSCFKPLLSTLKRSYQEPKLLEHRQQGMEKGFETSLAAASTTLGIGTAAAFVIGGRYSIPHAWIASVLLPHVLEWFQRAVPDMLHEIARLTEEDFLGEPLNSGDELIDFVRYVTASFKMPLRLHSFSVTQQDLIRCIDNILSFGGTSFLPVPVTGSDVEEILKKAF